MGPPLYNSLIPGSIVSIRCIKEEQLDEVTQEEPELDTIWDQELLVTYNMDVEYITYEDSVEIDMIIPSPYEANDEEWLNPFSTIIEDGAAPNFANSFYMKMGHYDEKFEKFEPHNSGDSSMMSPSYSACSRESCRT